ncbi:Condensin complex subunit 3, partial [Smittium culicis]
DSTVLQACIQLVASYWLKDADYNLVTLFEGLDVVDSTIADDTIKALLNSYPEIADRIEFSSKVWDELQPESAFILRHTLEYYKEKKDISSLEDRLPETLEVVKLIRKQLDSRSSSDERDFNHNEDDHDIEIADAEIDYIILQLLIISKNLDFLDELGRREMLTLMRKLLVIPDISEQHIGHIMDIIRKLALDETDFTQITVEVISGVQQNGEEALLIALFDISFVFGIDEISENLKKDELASVFMSALESENSEIQAIAAEGLAKLLYGGRIPNASLVLHNLAVMYFHILTVENLNLRQCLSYFFPAYCYSLPSNQKEMAKAVVPIFIEYSSCYYLEWKGKVSDTSFQTTTQINQQLFSWADPRISLELSKNIGSVTNDSNLGEELVWFFEIGVDALMAANNYCKNIDENSNLEIIVLIIKGLIQLTLKLGLENVPKSELEIASASYNKPNSVKNLLFVYEKLFILCRCLKLECSSRFKSDLVLKRGIDKLESNLAKLLKNSRLGYNISELFRDLLQNDQLRVLYKTFAKGDDLNVLEELNLKQSTVNSALISELDLNSDDIPNDSGDDAIFDEKIEKEEVSAGAEDIHDDLESLNAIENIEDETKKLNMISENKSIVKKNGILKPKKPRKSIDIKGRRPYPNKLVFDPKSELDSVRQQIDDILLDE